MSASATGPTLSVVMPAYNEADGIEAAVEGVRRQVLDRVPESELIVVNDGSRDATGQLLDAIARRDPRVRVIHKTNAGHGPAIMTGLAAAGGTWLFLVDSDDQIPMNSFASLWAAIGHGKAAAFGVRRVRQDARLRQLLTVVIRHSLVVLFGVRLHDANVPFKLLHRSIWEAAQAHIPEGTLAPSLLLAVFVARGGYDLALVEVGHHDRRTGTVSIRRWKLVKFCARGLRQLLAFRASLRRAA